MTASLNHSSEVYLAILSAAGKLVFSPGRLCCNGRNGNRNFHSHRRHMYGLLEHREP